MSYKIGDLIPGAEANKLPVGTVVRDQRGVQWTLTQDPVRFYLFWSDGNTGCRTAFGTIAMVVLVSLTSEVTTRPPGEPIRFTYRNHRGEVGERTVIPIRVFFGTGVNRPTPQWLLEAWCLDRGAIRNFTLANLNKV